MKNKLHYSPLALQDLDEIWGYIAANECSLDKESNLEGEHRFLAVGAYLIFYRIEFNAIYVDRILHRRRDNINIIFSNKNDVV